VNADKSLEPKSWTDNLEETLIAAILGIMTVLTFANVVARFMNLNILWALEATVFLFAWLVLLGASYAVRINAHLGVDVIINIVSPDLRRKFGIVSIGVCILFSIFLLKGSWDYWAPFANLPATSGRWLPTGFEEIKYRGWYEVDDVTMPAMLQWMADIFNEGERYEKMPRLIPYAVMPPAMALLLFRFIQAGRRLMRGEIQSVIVSHEAEEMVEEAAQRADKTG